MKRLGCWLVMLVCSVGHGAWEAVAPWDPGTTQPSDFADHELDVPYHLFHFHRIANAVTEEGADRGFLDIAVNREPKDNKPYNARIQEMSVALAYFYTTNRPWNPYYGSDAVRQRLEAMMQFWCERQAPDGLFSEYSPTNWSLAPTGFGARHMAATLEMLNAAQLPFDDAVLERTMSTQRRAIMALLTDERSHRWAQEYSNQITGVLKAAPAYLRLRDDAEMKAAFAAFLEKMSAYQSPAGFWYEQGGPCFGYSSVHLSNVRLAWPYREDLPGFERALVEEEKKWAQWLSYNLVLQPDGERFVVNAGINTRTSHWMQEPAARAIAEEVELTRSFTWTDEQWQRRVDGRRQRLEQQWGKWPELRVPSAYAYSPSRLEESQRALDTWHPTAEQKQAAIAQLPYLKSDRFVHQVYDPSRPYLYTYVRQPGYYAAFNSGRIRIPGRQYYGLGLLWHPKTGALMQSVAGTEFGWGTASGNGPLYERSNLDATIRVGGQTVRPSAGHRDLPGDGITEVTYALGDAGQKMLRFGERQIEVQVTHAGECREQIPLLLPKAAEITETPGAVRVVVNGVTLVIEHDPSLRRELLPAEPLDRGLQRVMLRLGSSGNMSYTLRIEE